MAKSRENLKKIRKLLKKSQEDLARVINKSRATVGKIEKGSTLLEYDDAKLIADYLDVPMDVLFDNIFLSPEMLSRIKNGESIRKEGGKDELISPQVVAVNEDDEELISLVEVRVHASYGQYYMNEEYIGELPKFSLPLRNVPPNNTYRVFEIKGDSMSPSVNQGDYLITKWLRKKSYARNGIAYVVVTKEKGIFYKRLTWKDEKFLLESDNKSNIQENAAFEVNVDYDVAELWEPIGLISFRMFEKFTL